MATPAGGSGRPAWVEGLEADPPVGRVRMGQLRRTRPISPVFGFERGLPVDRYYIERFLARHRLAVRGRALEVGDDSYTRRFGGEHVERSDVLHVDEGAPGATFTGDLARPETLPPATFDCIILTQTLHFIYELEGAVENLATALRPGGTLLATFPGISQISGDEWSERWCWGLMPVAARRLFRSAFPEDLVEVSTFGNVLAAVAFLHGLAAEELSEEELLRRDERYPMLVAVRAVRPPVPRAVPPPARWSAETLSQSGEIVGSIDSPGREPEPVGSRGEVAGWVEGLQRQAVAVELSLAGQESTLLRLPLDQPRPDAAIEVGPRGDRHPGFRGSLTVVPSRPWELEARVVLESQRRVLLGRVSVDPGGEGELEEGPRVAVVITCRDQAAFLPQAIESVLQQRVPPGEVVVVDAGSSDHTGTVVGRFPGVRYLGRASANLARARNVGLESSSAELVIFLDAEDRLAPGAVEEGVAALERRPEAAMAVGATTWIDEAGRRLGAIETPEVRDEWHETLLRNHFIPALGMVMFRRQALGSAPFDAGLRAAEDYDLYLRLSKEFPIHQHPALVVECRQHSDRAATRPGLRARACWEVLRRHRPSRRTPVAWASYQRGIDHWRSLHGELLARRAADHLGSGHLVAGLGSLASLLRYDPGRVWRVLRDGASGD